MIKRIIAGIFLCLSVIFFPAWLSVIFGAVFSFAFEWYLEFFAAALILDMIGSAPVPMIGGFLHFYSVLAAAILISSYAVRRFTRLLPRTTDE